MFHPFNKTIQMAIWLISTISNKEKKKGWNLIDVVAAWSSPSVHRCLSLLRLLAPPVTSHQSTAPSVILAPVLISTVPNGRHEVPRAPRHCLNCGVILCLQLQVGAAATQALADVLPRP